MKRTNSIRILDTFKASLVGLVAAAMGWCVYQPGVALALARGFNARTSAVLAGPFVANEAPTLGQLVAFAWDKTSLVPGMVFLSFFLTFSVVAYLIFEWAGRSKKSEFINERN